MGQITFRCPKDKTVLHNFPSPACWSCNECNTKGDILFKKFVVEELEKGHIFHMMKSVRETTLDVSSDCSVIDDDE